MARVAEAMDEDDRGRMPGCGREQKRRSASDRHHLCVCGQTEVFTLNPILLDWKHIEEQKERKLAGPA